MAGKAHQRASSGLASDQQHRHTIVTRLPLTLELATLSLFVAILVGIGVTHLIVLVPALFLVGFFFSQLGVLVGVRAEQFDDVAVYQQFVLMPLIFLGGVFYSATLLPQPFDQP